MNIVVKFLKNLITRFFPKLKIHIWGGLGSQLFALALAYELRKKYPFRNLVLVFHTSGVTKRIPELAEISHEFCSEYRDDFAAVRNLVQDDKDLITFVKHTIGKLLYRSGLVATANNDSECQNLKPWVLQLRGHYSYRSISDYFLFSLLKNLSVLNTDSFSTHTSVCFVHYRLGDLTTLAEKNPIDRNRLLSETKAVIALYSPTEIYVSSDSPELAGLGLSSEFGVAEQMVEVPTVLALALGIKARYFVGTSSKVSFWICILRARCLALPSSMPAEFRPEIGRNVDNTAVVRFY